MSAIVVAAAAVALVALVALVVVVAGVGFVACSSDSPTNASTSDAGSASNARPCYQFTKEKKCICEDTTVADDGGGNFFSVADCTPESQGAGSLCCTSETACSCAAPYEVRCIKGSLGNCKCIPDVRMDEVDEGQPRVDKCTPATDGTLQFHCCKAKDGTLSWPSCRCSLSTCDNTQTEVTECLPETAPRTCKQDVETQVATCKP